MNYDCGYIVHFRQEVFTALDRAFKELFSDVSASSLGQTVAKLWLFKDVIFYCFFSVIDPQGQLGKRGLKLYDLFKIRHN